MEVEVKSPVAEAEGYAPLVYKILATKGSLCHQSCRTCFGVNESACVTCRAPLVLFEGSCVHVDCPYGTYFVWRVQACRRCDARCAQCRGPELDDCLECPSLQFRVGKAKALTGSCTHKCPVGQFANPTTRRCETPLSALMQTFYVRFLFRMFPEDFLGDLRIQSSVVNSTAFVLGVSLTDVQAYKMEPGKDLGGGVHQDTAAFVEIVSPFITRAQVESVSVDRWFGAFEMPVDKIQVLTWTSMHPVPQPLPEDPLVPPWGFGLVFAVLLGISIVIPLYCCYFRRRANTKELYTVKWDKEEGVEHPFVVEVIQKNANDTDLRRFVKAEEQT